MLAVATTVYWMTAPLIVLGGVRTGLVRMLHSHVQTSWSERLDMWAFAAAKIVEKPWAGWGLDASRTFGSAISLHTHDAAIQIWLELGAVGAVLAAAFWIGVWSLIEALARRDRTAGRRRGGHGGRLSDHRRAQFRRLAGVVAGAGRHGRGGLHLPGPLPVRSPDRLRG